MVVVEGVAVVVVVQIEVWMGKNVRDSFSIFFLVAFASVNNSALFVLIFFRSYSVLLYLPTIFPFLH